MARRWPLLSASVVLLVATLSAPPARALDEPERLRLVGERAFADGLYPLARRVLERFVAEYPNDPHAGSALFLLGRARFALGDTESALEAFRRAQAAISPAEALEAKFWEAETLFRLRRFPEARVAYDAVVKTDAAAPRAPEALYGLAWSDLELGRPETAIAELREVLARWPDHALVPSATLHLARTLAEQKRFGDALPKRFCSARVRARWSVADGTSAWSGHRASSSRSSAIAVSGRPSSRSFHARPYNASGARGAAASVLTTASYAARASVKRRRRKSVSASQNFASSASAGEIAACARRNASRADSVSPSAKRARPRRNKALPACGSFGYSATNRSSTRRASG